MHTWATQSGWHDCIECHTCPNLKTNWSLQNNKPKVGLTLNFIRLYLISREKPLQFFMKNILSDISRDKRLERLGQHKMAGNQECVTFQHAHKTSLQRWRIRRETSCWLQCEMAQNKSACVCLYGAHYTIFSIFL